jgi:hypothetical protein
MQGKKARLPFLPLATLGLLAGNFIASGTIFYTAMITDSSLEFGPTRLLDSLDSGEGISPQSATKVVLASSALWLFEFIFH